MVQAFGFIAVFLVSLSDISAMKLFNQLKRVGIPKLATILASTTVGLNNIQSLVQPSVVHAATVETRYGAIADVGVKEFLVKDSKQHLRLSLPVGKDMKFGPATKQDPGRLAQEAIELIRLRPEQVGYQNKPVWSQMGTELGTAQRILTKQRDYFIKDTSSPETATKILDEQITPNLLKLTDAIKIQDIKTTLDIQDQVADQLVALRNLQIPPQKLPYNIPDEYSTLPRLAGRAQVEMRIDHKGGFRDMVDKSKVLNPQPIFIIEVDGYHAPITSGNFINYVQQNIYENIPLTSEELTIQATVPSTASNKIKNIQKIPLEIFFKSDQEPTYGITSDDDDRPNETMTLPFQAYGAIGMSRDNDDTDSATTNIFFLKWQQALIPPGRNTIDGFYSCFGYVTENQDLLKQVTDGDKIVSMKVIKGLENLEIPSR